MVTFKLTFSCESPETRDFSPARDQYGNDVVLHVTAENKTAAIYHADTKAFCAAQGNDCRVRRVD